ncbi:sulfur carrier protein ThiS [Halomonas denitrificans]|nr:sulfur carrier protein ThiS [Halomonas denitrificans]
MRVHVNGEAEELPESATVSTLLERLDLAGRRIAVECNGEIVPRSQHGDRVLRPDDRIEIVHAIGGG